MRYPSNYILTAIESQTKTVAKTITISGADDAYDIISSISSFSAPVGYTLPDYRLTHLKVLERKGYDYDGLYTDAAFTTEFLESSTVGSATTLYTKWLNTEQAVEDFDTAVALVTDGPVSSGLYDYSQVAYSDGFALHSKRVASSPYYAYTGSTVTTQPSSRVTSVGLGKRRTFPYQDSTYGLQNGYASVFALGLLSSPYLMMVSFFDRQSGSHISTDISDNVDTLPTGTVYATEFCLGESYLATGHATTPFLTVYETNSRDIRAAQENGWNSTVYGTFEELESRYDDMTFTKLDNPTTLPTGKVMDVAWGGYDQEYLAAGHYNSPYLSIYERSGETLTKLSNPTTLPTAAVISLSMSADGVYLACIQDASPYLVIYKRSGSTFTKITAPTTTFTSPTTVDLSPSGDMVIADNQKIFRYRRSGDTFIEEALLDEGLSSITKLSAKYNLEGSVIIAGQDQGPGTYGQILKYT